jgi:hypothetical protein
LLLTLGLRVSAHKEPKTEKEIEVQRALQAAAYHVRPPSCFSDHIVTALLLQCAPAVESFTAQRKQAWAQKVLGGVPGYQQLFDSGTYEDLRKEIESSESDKCQTIMGCTPISETHIQNNTCVLAPEVTEGPYYHTEGHPIRQNIAELQDGLLLVRRSVVIRVEYSKNWSRCLISV